ncbi:TonB-dependent receptor [Pseudomaricurvus alcaniphilus]|uniref:TonB-dependent receptor n=1 Tax=Pseudomaricurvus alcaniphilus TaxID=1166482 RepID=UPI00140A94BB|nr:TonB-dependent receptor [Pseudomaricurvus alcaniphilus]NHN36837.1 TonB-dependent receptor [Pseudomaricurvus alcaniphilus]
MTNAFTKTTANSGKTTLLAAVALASQALLATPAVAQSQQGKAWTLEEITVTARRVTESLQDVPTAVTAITKDGLEALQIDGFLGVGQTVPNLYIQKQGGAPTAPQMQIRGVSNGSLNMQVDSGIGLYVDGVYLGRPGAASFDLADLERVEVMRGPQGTLFGRNSTGGAINLISATPTGELGGKLKMGFGNFDAHTVRGVLNLSEFHGLSTKLTLLDKQAEGDVDNISSRHSFQFPEPFGTIHTAERGGDDDTEAFSLALRYQGIEGLTVDYRYEQANWKGTKNFRQPGSIGPCVDFATTTGQCAFATPGLLTEVHSLPLDFDYRDELANPMETPAGQDTWGHSLTLEYDLSEALAVKYIYGDRGHELESGGNQVWGAHEHYDALGSFGTAGDLWTPLFALRAEEQDQKSHELQLIGSHEKFEWIVGGFYFQEEGSVNNPIFLFRTLSTTSINPISVTGFDYFVGQNVEIENTSKALYAHLTYHIGDVDISAGVRRTEDEREEFIIAAGLIGAVQPGNASFETDGDNTDYDISLTYNLSDAMNVYYKYATGFVSGGTLMGNAFEKEEIKSHEIGLKSDMLGSRLRINAAIFDMERTDIQIEGFTGIGYFMGQGEGVDSQGAELEVTYLPFEGMTVNFNYGYTDVDMSGDLRTFQPANTAYLGVQYDFAPIGGVSPSVRVDASWRDDVWRLACAAGTDQIPATDTCVGTPIPELDRQAQLKASTNLGAVVSFDDIRFSADLTGRVAIWGRNLLDEDGKEFGFTLGGPTLTNTFMRPRTYGVDFEVMF